MKVNPSRLRAVVAQVNSITQDIQVSVTHEPYASTDSDGKRSYGTAVTRTAYKINSTKAVTRLSGIEAVGGPTLLFLSNVTFDVRDRLTMDDGTQPPIVEVSGDSDPAGGTYYTRVVCGRPERGQVT